MRASGYDRTADDWYIEPRWVVDALLRVEEFDGLTIDPSCGSGTIPKALIEHGIHARGSDIAHRGYGQGGVDFFASKFACRNIISNPPYGELQRWVDHALECASHKVAVIARLAFLESMRRKAWFEKIPLARVWVSSRRVSMPPGGADVPARGGSIAYAWFVFDHEHQGMPVLGWLP